MRTMAIAFGIAWACPALSSGVQDSVEAFEVQNFEELMAAIKSDALGSIKLSDLTLAYMTGNHISYRRENPVYGFTLAVEVDPLRGKHTITFYLPDNGYSKLGASYDSAYAALTSKANSIGSAKQVSESEDISDKTQQGTWIWQSGLYECTLIINNGEYLGGDFLFECR